MSFINLFHINDLILQNQLHGFVLLLNVITKHIYCSHRLQTSRETQSNEHTHKHLTTEFDSIDLLKHAASSLTTCVVGTPMCSSVLTCTGVTSVSFGNVPGTDRILDSIDDTCYNKRVYLHFRGVKLTIILPVVTGNRLWQIVLFRKINITNQYNIDIIEIKERLY